MEIETTMLKNKYVNLRQNEKEKDDFKITVLEKRQDHRASDGGKKS